MLQGPAVCSGGLGGSLADSDHQCEGSDAQRGGDPAFLAAARPVVVYEGADRALQADGAVCRVEHEVCVCVSW